MNGTPWEVGDTIGTADPADLRTWTKADDNPHRPCWVLVHPRETPGAYTWAWAGDGELPAGPVLLARRGQPARHAAGPPTPHPRTLPAGLAHHRHPTPSELAGTAHPDTAALRGRLDEVLATAAAATRDAGRLRSDLDTLTAANTNARILLAGVLRGRVDPAARPGIEQALAALAGPATTGRRRRPAPRENT